MTTALDAFVPGQQVRLHWTNCNRQFEGIGIVSRVNAQTIRANVDVATILWSGYDWKDGELIAAKREPSTAYGTEGTQNIIVPFPGTPGNRAESLEEVTSEQIEEAKTNERERLQRKADRFSGFANSAYRSSNEAWDRSHELVEAIPLGQPILVDHYSARGHIRRLERSRNLTDKAISEGHRAAGWSNRADGVQREMRRKGLA